MISRFCRTGYLVIHFSGEQTVDSLVCVHDLLIAGVNIKVVCQHEVAVAADPLNCLGIDTSLVKHTKELCRNYLYRMRRMNSSVQGEGGRRAGAR